MITFIHRCSAVPLFTFCFYAFYSGPIWIQVSFRNHEICIFIMSKHSCLLHKDKYHDAGARRPRDLLKSYYGISDDSHNSGQHKTSKEQNDEGKPCDINGPNFDPEVYLSKLLKVVVTMNLHSIKIKKSVHLSSYYD